jgi:hypothetical protein
MNKGQHTGPPVHGCILLIPSDLFTALEREAARRGLTPEAMLLRVLEWWVARTTEKQLAGSGG